MLTHQLIIGQTLSGKTTIAKQLSTKLRGLSIPVLVHDPTSFAQGPSKNGWNADFVFNNFADFREAFWRSTGCYVVIDEASDIFDNERNEARRMLQQGRHRGHVCALIAQRHKRLDKTAREQCSELYAFVVDREDAADLAMDWNDDALLSLPDMPPLHYIQKRRHEPSVRGVAVPMVTA